MPTSFATLADLKRAYKAANCAASKIAEGGCECTMFGLSAGNGWRITVICGGETFKWELPPRNESDGVGFNRDFTCESLENNMRDILELLDNERSDLIPVPRQSWQWPSSFFVDEQGKPINQTPDGQSEVWIRKYCAPLTGPPYDLQAGDVVLFDGTSAINPSQRINHSAIATGRGDEISQMWWTHEIQQHMVDSGKFTPTGQPGPQNGGYSVTRDSLADIEKRFTDPQTGLSYLTNSYSVWRIKDDWRANFEEFSGCD